MVVANKDRQKDSSSTETVRVLFSDFFGVTPENLEKFGAYNVSLVTDLPLFIDPFLLFGSNKDEYQALHEEVIKYLRFLRDRSHPDLRPGLLKSWYQFKEVHQNWFGFTSKGNRGSGLGSKFALSLNSNLLTLLTNFGNEKLTLSSHLEKLCLVEEGVGKDAISDFTTNMIKGYLAEYTETFAKKYLREDQVSLFPVEHAEFDYKLGRWKTKRFLLPKHQDDYVLLTPADLLTREDTWINRTDLIKSYDILPSSLPNEALRAQVNEYFQRILNEKEEPTKKDEEAAAIKTILRYPVLVDAYIRIKEDSADEARTVSEEKVHVSEEIYLQNFPALISKLREATSFYEVVGVTKEEAMQRVRYLKHVIENCDGYRTFYIDDKPLKTEEHLQVLYKMAWYASPLAADREVNNGRGPVDFKISLGAAATLVEFKLARNSQLRSNLLKQVEIYQSANPGSAKIKVILFFNEQEEQKVETILKELGLMDDQDIVLIDARNDNKPSASKA
ncbi:MAG: hypothetical protein AAB617_01660 [Patescibacteria group bacterium]